MFVVGDRESTDGTVSVRTRTGGDQGANAINPFIAAALEEIRSKGGALDQIPDREKASQDR